MLEPKVDEKCGACVDINDLVACHGGYRFALGKLSYFTCSVEILLSDQLEKNGAIVATEGQCRPFQEIGNISLITNNVKNLYLMNFVE